MPARGPSRPDRGGPARLPPVRVRTFELRLVAVVLTALWFLGALYVLLGYRPGGPIDGLVGAAATLPMAIALAAVFWPPVARSDRAFAVIVWLGLLAGLLLVPSIGGVLNQLLGPRAADAAAVGRVGLPVAGGADGDQPVRRSRHRPTRPGRDRTAADRGWSAARPSASV